MKIIAVIVSIISLSICIITPFLTFFSYISFATYLLWFNVASLFWILSAPRWMVPELFKSKV